MGETFVGSGQNLPPKGAYGALAGMVCFMLAHHGST